VVARLGPGKQGPEVFLQLFRIFKPRLAVDPNGSIFAGPSVGILKPLLVQMMSERGEGHVALCGALIQRKDRPALREGLDWDMEADMDPKRHKVLTEIDPNRLGNKSGIHSPKAGVEAGQAAMRLVLGPSLMIPLDFAKRLVQQLGAAAREAPSSSLGQDAEALQDLIDRQFPKEISLGRHVQVVRALEVYNFSGGWGDGPVTLHPGAKLFLERQVGGEVYFSAGSQPDPQLGGKFVASDLDAVEDL